MILKFLGFTFNSHGPTCFSFLHRQFFHLQIPRLYISPPVHFFTLFLLLHLQPYSPLLFCMEAALAVVWYIPTRRGRDSHCFLPPRDVPRTMSWYIPSYFFLQKRIVSARERKTILSLLNREGKSYSPCSAGKENHTLPAKQWKKTILSLLSRERKPYSPCSVGKVWFSVPVQ